MFSEAISSVLIPRCGSLSGFAKLFGNYHISNPFSYDSTANDVICALGYNRLPKDKHIQFFTDDIHIGYPYSEDVCINRIFNSLYVQRENQLNYIFAGNHSKLLELKTYFEKDRVKERCEELGYTRLLLVEKFIHDRANVDVIVLNAVEQNQTRIYVSDRMSIAAYHLLVSFVPLYFKTLFEDKPLTDIEKTLLKSLTETTSNKYVETINKIIVELDFRNEIIDSLLKDIYSSVYDSRIATYSNEVSSYERRITDALSQYETLLRRKFDIVATLEGLKLAKESNNDSTELIEYIKTNKNIDIVSVNDGELNIIVRGVINNFSVDAFESIARRSNIYAGYSCTRNFNKQFAKINNCKMLFEHIFCSEPDFQIKTCGCYKLAYSGAARAISGNDIYGKQYDDYVPNPHLHLHACLGGNGPLIQNALKDGDFISAIECCAASVGNVNVLETSMTFRPFLQEVLNNSNKILIRNDGVEMTTLEALNWLNEKYKETKE